MKIRNVRFSLVCSVGDILLSASLFRSSPSLLSCLPTNRKALHPPIGIDMAGIVDDKSEYCIPFLLERIRQRQQKFSHKKPPPFFLGINGVQGAGKSTLV